MASTLNISLPDPLKEYVEAQTESGDYGTPSQFIRELIQDDRDRRRSNLEEQLLLALKEESQALEFTPEEWKQGGIARLMEERLKARG